MQVKYTCHGKDHKILIFENWLSQLIKALHFDLEILADPCQVAQTLLRLPLLKLVVVDIRFGYLHRSSATYSEPIQDFRAPICLCALKNAVAHEHR
jgi:hypothetical protein